MARRDRTLRYKRWNAPVVNTLIEHYKCCLCGKAPTEGYVFPLYANSGTPDYCYKCYRQRRGLFAMELLVHGEA